MVYPPLSNNVSINIGKKFWVFWINISHLTINLTRYSTATASYICMPNMVSIIKRHNAKLTRPASGNFIPDTSEATCNCRNKNHCPLNGNCTKSCIVYQATITWWKQSNVYFGSCSTTFKARFNNHTSSFRHGSKVASMELSKHIWKLRTQTTPTILREA